MYVFPTSYLTENTQNAVEFNSHSYQFVLELQVLQRCKSIARKFSDMVNVCIKILLNFIR